MKSTLSLYVYWVIDVQFITNRNKWKRQSSHTDEMILSKYYIFVKCIAWRLPFVPSMSVISIREIVAAAVAVVVAHNTRTQNTAADAKQFYRDSSNRIRVTNMPVVAQ